MNYRKIIPCLLLLFFTSQSLSMQWIQNNPIECIIFLSVAYWSKIVQKWMFYIAYRNRCSLLMNWFASEAIKKEALYYEFERYKEKSENSLFFLIEYGVNADASYNGFSCLRYACCANDLALLKVLLKARINPNNQNFKCLEPGPENGRSFDEWIREHGQSLVIAFHQNNREIINLLIRYKAQPLIYIQELYDEKGNWDPRYMYRLIKPLEILDRSSSNKYHIFNHLIDYMVKQKDDKMIYKYWLLGQIPFNKDIMSHIAPHIVVRKFDECVDLWIENCQLQGKDKEDTRLKIYEHKNQILQTRSEQNNFLPIVG